MVGYINCGASQLAKQDQGGNILLNVIVFVKSSDEACIMYRLLVLWNKLLNGIIFIYSKLWFNIMCHLFFFHHELEFPMGTFEDEGQAYCRSPNDIERNYVKFISVLPLLRLVNPLQMG